MSQKTKKIAVVAAACCSISICSAMYVSAAETGTAYIFLRDVAEDGVRFEDVDSSVNTINSGVSTQTIEKDGSYTVQIDLSKESAYETVDEISMLKLYVTGTENTKNVEIVFNDLKINGDTVSLTSTPEIKTSGNDYYFDLCDTNGDELFNRTDYVNTIKTIAIDFMVKGWPEESSNSSDNDTPAENVTDAPVETAILTTTTTEPENSIRIDTPSDTGDNSPAIVTVAAATAFLSVLSLRKKK